MTFDEPWLYQQQDYYQRTTQLVSLSVCFLTIWPPLGMSTLVINWLNRASVAKLTTIAIVLLALVAALDYLTGYDVSVSFFYLIPIVIALHASSRLGYLFCIVSAATWGAMDYLAGHPYGFGFSIIWNAAIRLGFFVITAYLLVELRMHIANEHAVAIGDELTGTLNRRAFREACHNVLSAADRYHHAMALGYIDIDNFKTVNDTRGHPEGDRVLRATSATIFQHVRSTDIVGRLGGDEFSILLPETDYSGATIMFDRIHGALTTEAKRSGWPIGYSMGVAVFYQIPGSVDDALKVADELMYCVKRSGKNTVLYREY